MPGCRQIHHHPLIRTVLVCALTLSAFVPAAGAAQPGCVDGTWQPVSTSSVYPLVNSVSGQASPIVYAVGDGGLILRFDGSSWSQMNSGTAAILRGVWVVADNDVYAVGGGLRHYDGATWSGVDGAPGGSDVVVSNGQVIVAKTHEVDVLVDSVWVAQKYACHSWTYPPNDPIYYYYECYTIDAIWPKPGGGWIGGGTYIYSEERTGEYIHYAVFFDDGVIVPCYTAYEFVDVWAGGGIVYLVDSNGAVFTSSGGATPGAIPLQPPGGVLRLAGTGANPFGVDDAGRIVAFDGAAWTVAPEVLGVGPEAGGANWLWGESPESCVGVADHYLYRHDASGFTLWGNEGGPGTLALQDVWVDETGSPWVAASRWLYRYDGAAWSMVEEAPAPITAVWGRRSYDVVAADEDGNVTHRYGAELDIDPLAVDRLNDVAGAVDTGVYAVGTAGDTGRIYRLESMQWNLFDTIPSPATAASVRRRGDGVEVLVVGTENGDLYRYLDGARGLIPDVFQAGIVLPVTGVWTDSDDAFVVGGGLMSRVDLATATVADVDTAGFKLYSVWGTAVDNVWAAGYSSNVFHYDGATLTRTFLNHASALNGVYGTDPCNVYTVGDYGRAYRLDWPIGVADTPPPPPALRQNYPNPFNPTTTIPVRVGRGVQAVTLRVYDVTGRLVRTLLANEPVSGERLVPWDGTNDAGESVPSGIYFCEMRSGDVTHTRKMVVIR